MCRQTALDLPPVPASAGAARRFIAEMCERWELPELRDDLLLAVSELVTNSILHARTPISVTVTVAGGIAEVGVRDHDPTPPVLRPPRADLVTDLDTLSHRLPSFEDPYPRHPALVVGAAGSVASGRGLHLLDAVADSWGVASITGDQSGKEVWFAIAIPLGWPHAHACHCSETTATTASGRRIAHVAGRWD